MKSHGLSSVYVLPWFCRIFEICGNSKPLFPKLFYSPAFLSGIQCVPIVCPKWFLFYFFLLCSRDFIIYILLFSSNPICITASSLWEDFESEKKTNNNNQKQDPCINYSGCSQTGQNRLMQLLGNRSNFAASGTPAGNRYSHQEGRMPSLGPPLYQCGIWSKGTLKYLKALLPG